VTNSFKIFHFRLKELFKSNQPSSLTPRGLLDPKRRNWDTPKLLVLDSKHQEKQLLVTTLTKNAHSLEMSQFEDASWLEWSLRWKCRELVLCAGITFTTSASITDTRSATRPSLSTSALLSVMPKLEIPPPSVSADLSARLSDSTCSRSPKHKVHLPRNNFKNFK